MHVLNGQLSGLHAELKLSDRSQQWKDCLAKKKDCRRQIACLALTTCWFVEMGQFNLARTVSRKTPFYFKLPLVFHHLRESDVGFKTTPIILEKAVGENQQDLPAALHARDNILNRCNADLGKSSHFFRFNKLQPIWKGWKVHIQLFQDVIDCKSFCSP